MRDLKHAMIVFVIEEVAIAEDTMKPSRAYMTLLQQSSGGLELGHIDYNVMAWQRAEGIYDLDRDNCVIVWNVRKIWSHKRAIRIIMRMRDMRQIKTREKKI